MCYVPACCLLYGWLVFHGTGTVHLFTHSPVCSHFDCLHPLAIVDSGIVNTGMKDFTWTHISILLDTHVGVEMQDHMVVLCLSFWGPAKLSSHPSHCCGRTQFLLSLVVNSYFLFFTILPSWRAWGGISLWICMAFSQWQWASCPVCLGHLSHWLSFPFFGFTFFCEHLLFK